MGYFIEYKIRTPLFEKRSTKYGVTDSRKRLLVSREVLVSMLQRPYSYLILSATLVDVEQFRMNHLEIDDDYVVDPQVMVETD